MFLLGGVFFLFSLFFLITLIPLIFYILTIRKTLNIISLKNRQMTPDEVWLLIVPMLGLIWHFFVVSRLADSIRLEADDLGLSLGERKPAYNLGIAMCIFTLFSFTGKGGPGLIGLVLWIIYWVKIDSYRRQLEDAKRNDFSNIGRYQK